MCFEEASRIEIKISFTKIASVLDRGEITGWCNISHGFVLLHGCWHGINAAGMELITLIMKKLCSRLSCSSSTEKKSQILPKP